MRARWLKPEFFTDKKIGQLDPVTALVFQALWCWADDGGTAQADPEVIKAQVFYRWSAVTVPGITGALHTLSALGRVTVYRVGDEAFARIWNWERHQAVHKPSKFRYPKPEHELIRNSAALVPESPVTSVEIPTARIPDSQTPRVPLSRERKKPRHEVVKASWLAPYCAVWEAKHGAGSFETVAGQAAKALAPLVKAKTDPAMIATYLRSYLDQTEPKYQSLTKFAQTFAQWAPSDPATWVVDGVMSDEFERMTRPAGYRP